MVLSLDPNQDIDRLKLEVLSQKFPHGSAQKLNELLLDDQIQTEEFIKEFNKIIASTESLSGKSLLYVNNLKDRFIDQIASISWPQIFFVLFLFTTFYLINKKYPLKTPTKKIATKTSNILERIAALFGYFVPLVIGYTAYLMPLLPTYPYLNLIVPNFMRTAIAIYMRYPQQINYGYFFGIAFLCVQFKLPRPRFVRFHFIRGLMLLAFQSVPDLIFQSFRSSVNISQQQYVTTTLFIFVINLFWILPCLFQAVTYTYPRSGFIRDAIEITLGRDNDENFKWWDRK